MGTADKLVRIIVAILFGALYATGTVTGTAGVVLLILAVVFLATATMSFCPLYTIFGLRTNKGK